MKRTRNFFYLAAFLISTYATSLSAQTVYIAETGKKHHTKDCPEVLNSKKAMSLKKAIKKGYTACTNCGADKLEPKKKKVKKELVENK